MTSTTSSFRISAALRARLEQTARQMKKRKNWIINQALDEYLKKVRRESLVAEARRQSLLASARTTADERFWGRQADDRGWR